MNFTRANVLFSEAFFEDPYPIYSKLRERGPVFVESIGAWVAARFNDISAILQTPSFSKRPHHSHIVDSPEGDRCYKMIKNWMLTHDGDLHSTLRHLFEPLFDRGGMILCDRIVRDTIEDLCAQWGPGVIIDFIRDFAEPLPRLVMTRLLGVPPEDTFSLLQDMAVPVRLLDPLPLSSEDRDSANEQINSLQCYFHAILTGRRPAVKESMLSRLCGLVRDRDEEFLRLVVDNTILVFCAGLETTTHLLGNSMNALLTHSTQLELAKRMTLGDSAVDELLRYDSPVQLSSSRFVLEDLSMSGVQLRSGDRIICALGSGNRDPQAFHDPDELNLSRVKGRALGFGLGPHFCLGARLARLECRMAFTAFLLKFPNLQLNGSISDKIRLRSYTVRGFKSLSLIL